MGRTWKLLSAGGRMIEFGLEDHDGERVTLTASGWNVITFFPDGPHLHHGLPSDFPLPVDENGCLVMAEPPRGD